MREEALQIRPAPGGGSLLRLRVRPGASRNGLEGIHGGALKVSVSAQPEKGKANKAVLAALAAALGLRKQDLSLAKGEGSRDKWVAVRGLHPKELEERIRRALKP